MKHIFKSLALLLLAATAHGQAFNSFQPATGILKGSASSFITSAAASSDVIALWSGACSASTFLRGDGACLDLGANPSASIGLTAVNGAATTYHRSDSAPALSQAIVPTWTGVHLWSLTEPRLKLNQTGAAADVGLWDFDLAAGVLTGRTRTDADGAGKNWLAVTRGATTAISKIDFGNAVDNPPFNFLGGGRATFANIWSTGGGIASTAAIVAIGVGPAIVMYDTSRGADLKGWDVSVTGGQWLVQTQLDNNTAPVNAIAITRGTTTTISDISVGNATNNNTFQFLGTGNVTSGGQLIVSTVGKGLSVKEGTNAKMGTATLVAGAVTVSTTAVTANSRILLTSQSDGGTPGYLRVSARTAGTSFAITSGSGTDTSTVAWMIVEPSP